jgi:hypothetical protein
VKIRFHSNENIEWHCMHVELKFNSNILIEIWIELNWIPIQLKSIEKGWKLVKKILKNCQWIYGDREKRTLKRHNSKKLISMPLYLEMG